MYKSLLISSFRGLRDLKMDDLARVNLISGSNNIGKTAVLEAILLLAAGPLAGRIALDMIRPFRGSPSLPITGGLEGGPWDFIFPNLDSSSEIRLESMTDEGSYNLTLSIPGNLTASQ
ncbi:MAG: hypothetical protein ACREN8_13955 [Candidatus Dormibacteraceae bacterium]